MNTIRPYEDLANAIVIRAVADYRRSLRALARNPQNVHAANVKRMTEIFLRSEWCRFLCNIDGTTIINRINREENV